MMAIPGPKCYRRRVNTKPSRDVVVSSSAARRVAPDQRICEPVPVSRRPPPGPTLKFLSTFMIRSLTKSLVGHVSAPLLLLVFLSLCAYGKTGGAQDVIRSATDWRTLQTRWFDVHYPLDAEAWTRDLAPRLDAIRDSVAALVGYAPPGRTTILVDDPYNVANGKAVPLLGRPVIHLWVTPPGPTDVIANHRGWALKLVAHEFGHIAHLTRPARRSQWFWHLAPAQVSPLSLGTPRWATEGYATWIEGRITGSGRPHGSARPSLLRELALEGRLPTYAAMSGGGGYKGGSLAYLAGSAFWEWLEAIRGDTSMALVFRRQTARTRRSFDEAFRGVYGDSPAIMYGRFAADLAAKAFAVDTAVRRAGLVRGTRLTRFAGAVGGPAASRDGRLIALAVPATRGAPRVIVTKPDTQSLTEREREQLARASSRDPLDVPSLRAYPRLAEPTATLRSRGGRTFGNPRFIDSAGTRVLVESWGVQRDGSQRPDLAVWNTTTSKVHFVTNGAGIQDADPSPDGTRAAAIRCVGGVCDLVLVSLTVGSVTILAHGSPTTVFSHPRWSADGARLVTSVQRSDGLWRLALVQLTTGTLSLVTPADDVNRHSASFDARGEHLLYVSEAGGISNLESMRLSDTSRVARTRVLGSVAEPAPLPDGSVMYLEEHAGGMDLHRLRPSDGPLPDTTAMDASRLAPAMPRKRVVGVTLPVAAVPASVVYRIGPRQTRALAQASAARDGAIQMLSVSSADPANRLTMLATVMGGTRAAWRGGTASAVWYGSRPNVRAEALWLEQRATAQRGSDQLSAADVRVAGGSAAADLPIAGSASAQRIYGSVFVGAAQTGGASVLGRSLLTVQYHGTRVIGWRATAGGSVRVATGRLGDSSFTRASGSAFVNSTLGRVDVRMHRASTSSPRFEQFSAGGFAPPLTDDASMGQRIAIPSLPVGVAGGTALYELRLSRTTPYIGGSLYAHSVGSGWQPDRHSAVLGIERGFAADYLGLVGLPRVRVIGGVARIVRGPLRDRGSAYFSVGWRP